MFERDCLCGHMWAAHAHYRAGSECAACNCARYHAQARQGATLVRLVRWLRGAA